jgi:ABC-type nitrate/sulfonate/bicarbonate transport system substrate-binding protein
VPKFPRAFLCLLVMLLVAPAHAAEKLRVGTAVAFAWTFTPLDVGIQTGIFAKHGLEIEASDATGDAKLQQALTADSLDVGIGSGPGMAFMAKGVPAKAVAAMAGVPRNMAVMVGYNSTAKTVDDLKGRKLGVTTVGSLTDWIGKRINALKGWGAEGITTARSTATSARSKQAMHWRRPRNGGSSRRPRRSSTSSSPMSSSCGMMSSQSVRRRCAPSSRAGSRP